MSAKILPWLFLVIAILVIAIMAMRQPDVVHGIDTRIETRVVRDTVIIPVYRSRVITKIDTLFIDNHEYTVARYKERIDTTRVSIDLDIAYWEQLRKFDVKAMVLAETDTVYVTETITRTVVKNPPPLSLIAGLNPMFKIENGRLDLDNVGAEAGIRISGKYDLTARANTREMVGLGFTVRF